MDIDKFISSARNKEKAKKSRVDSQSQAKAANSADDESTSEPVENEAQSQDSTTFDQSILCFLDFITDTSDNDQQRTIEHPSDASSPYATALTTMIKKRSWGARSKKRVMKRRLTNVMLHAVQVIKDGKKQWNELCNVSRTA